MFHWLRKAWNSFADQRNVARETNPEALSELSREVRDLARAVDHFWVEEPRFRDRLRMIEQEMLLLEEVIRRPSFRCVSREKRLQIRKSLIESREHLLGAIKEAPTASSLPQ